MAISSKLQVVTKDSNNQLLNRTVSYVNPETSDSDLTTFAMAYTGLSRRTFSEVYRIDREDITNATAEPAEPAVNVTPAVTIANNVITFASPYFTPARENELEQKIICDIVNKNYAGKSSGVTYETVTGFSEDDSYYNVLGTLSDGSVITAENATSNNRLQKTKLTRNAENIILYGNYANDERAVGTLTMSKFYVSLDKEYLVNQFIAGTLTIANCISALNTSLETEFAEHELGGVPQFTYTPSAGSITFAPSFGTGNAYAFVLSSEDTDGNALLRELIGDSLFESYYDENQEYYYYVILNPDYTE